MTKRSGITFYLKLAIMASFLFIALFGFFGLSGPDRSKASVFGPIEAHTGAPGEATCTNCHLSEKGDGNIVFTGLPVNYRPGQQYSVTVTLNHFNAVLYGFEATTLDNTGAFAGSYQLPAMTPQQLQTKNGFVEDVMRTYIEHTVDGVNPPMPNSKSWTFNWTAPATRKGRVTFYAAGNAANGNNNTTGDFIYTGSNSTYSGTPIASFDGDGKTDLSVYRPGATVWYSLNSTNGNFNAQQFGSAGDKIMPGDFDGDGKTDRAVYRPSTGNWFFIRSSDGQLYGNTFGIPGDIPSTGDFDGDGKTDLAIFRPSNGTWYILMIGTGQVQITGFGSNGDKPVPGDYDADGKYDIALYRPTTGNWFVLQSSNSQVMIDQFGTTGDKPVPADYDGDGKHDFAVFRPSTGVWFVRQSSGGYGGNQFGVSTDVPVPGDYDGDGKTDFAIYRNGAWYVLRTSDQNVSVAFFGLSGDVPVPTGYIPE